MNDTVVCTDTTCIFRSYSHYWKPQACRNRKGVWIEAPLAEWERVPLEDSPLSEADEAVDRYTQAVEEAKSHVTIHMLPSEFGTACEINLHDGYEHQVTSDYKKVTCKGCRLNYSAYIIEQQEILLAKQSTQILQKDEELRSARAVTANLRQSLKDADDNLRYAKNALASARAETRRLAHRNRRQQVELNEFRGEDLYALYRSYDRYGNRY